MELISKISKGTRMDQIYLPKKRAGFSTGSYVVIKPLETKIKEIKPFFYNIKYLEPIKIEIINEIFRTINHYIKADNIIITGSFLDKGFGFNDIDVLIISEEKINLDCIEDVLENNLGIKFHLILITNKALIKGISTDPLYRLMLSKCASKKRFVYRIKRKINYKILDLHLFKSKALIENFDFLNGKEKYEMIRNAISIALFIDDKEVSKDKVDGHINKLFGKNMNKKIKENTIADKKNFLDKYRKFYKDLSFKILNKIKNGSEQK